jgi:hypothetical protein
MTRLMNSARRTAAVLTAAVTVTGASFLAAPSAFAEDTPTVNDLVMKCGDADFCEFHPEGAEEAGPDQEKVIDDHIINCSSTDQQMSYAWTNTQGESNSIGVSVEAGFKFGEVFSASVTTTYGHEWNWSKASTKTSTLHVAPGKVGALTQLYHTTKVHGNYELHFGDKYYDHYIWYAPFDSTTVLDVGETRFTDRDATAEECPGGLKASKKAPKAA